MNLSVLRASGLVTVPRRSAFATMMPPLMRLLRPGDWVKNLFVFPALVFGLPAHLERGESLWPMVGAATMAFVVFCLIASGFYAINDVLDAEKDRGHPVKRRRPVAAGTVRPGTATGLGVVLIALAIGLAYLVAPLLMFVLVLYALLQIGYNFGIKRVMFVDVIALASGFALRATAGAAAMAIPISIWLLLCVFFLCVFLGFVKRMCDLSSAGTEAGSTWRSPAGYDDPLELNWLLGMSGALAVVTYLMYALSEHAFLLFGVRALGFALLSPLAMLCMHRFYRLARRGETDSPLAVLRSDRVVMVTAVCFSIGVLATLWFPPIERVLDGLFLARPELLADEGLTGNGP